MGISKNRKSALENVDLNKSYTLDEASTIVKENAKANFDESIELAVRLGVDPRRANQMVRGVASLPHGTGKNLKVLVTGSSGFIAPHVIESCLKSNYEVVGIDLFQHPCACH